MIITRAHYSLQGGPKKEKKHRFTVCRIEADYQNPIAAEWGAYKKVNRYGSWAEEN